MRPTEVNFDDNIIVRSRWPVGGFGCNAVIIITRVYNADWMRQLGVIKNELFKFKLI